ncbi:MAG: cation-translocating P-type ATPase [Bacilli bacterium]|nr:cation-translocating P-type ATPase [Bacilli bacterium]
MNGNINISFETKSANETASLLKTNIEDGLSLGEARKRQLETGENKLEEGKRKSLIRIFFEQMKNPMIYILFGAMGVTAGIEIYYAIKGQASSDWTDIIIVLAVILLNSLIGTIQERKAQASLDALKKLSSPMVNVIRDGNNEKISSKDLTIGDLVILAEGDIVPADIRLTEAYNLKINESALTGESVPVEKNANMVFSKSLPIGDRLNMVHSSTVITYGRGKGIVTSIGMDTEIGKIANSIMKEDNDLTPLQKVLAKLSKALGILTLIIVVLVFIADLVWIFVRGQSGVASEWIEAVLSSIALAVAAIPEGLVAVVTIVLAIGVTRMVKANTIIRKLPSVETLGSVNVICSDKTGTLTQNRMMVVEAYTNDQNYKEFVGDKNLNLLAKGFALCSDATLTYGDPTEIALVVFADKLGFTKANLEKENPRIEELPFDSVRKMMSTRHKSTIYTKGALDSILKHTSFILIDGNVRKITNDDIKKINKGNQEYASKALRVLALAYSIGSKIKEEDLIFVGLVAMIDPPRKEAKAAVNTLKGAGIRTVMITGDYPDTAFAIAQELDIATSENQCMSGTEIDKLTPEQLKSKVKFVNVFARVSPQNKVDIVKAIKANDLTVAMTGDGVNDAPSLKAADIGVSMGITGTDVAKDASDMILTDDNFASIEKAVEEGRGIFNNIKKTVLFLLSSNIAEVLTMFILICVGLPAPFVAIHLLWINLITDSTPAIALGMDPKDKNVMKEKPRDKKVTFLSNGGLNKTLIYGGIITISVIIAYFIPAWMNNVTDVRMFYENNSLFLGVARTMAFVTLAFGELFHMLGMSADSESFITVFKKKNIMMIFAFVIGFALQVFVVATPGVNDIFKTRALDYKQWLIAIALSLLPLLVHELVILFKKVSKKKK